MSLLPLPTRLPARKHVLAGVFALLGLAVMVGAVMTASGLSLPFTSGKAENVRAGSIVVDAPTTTAVPTTSSTIGGDARSRALLPAAVPGPSGNTAPTTAPPRGATTTAPTSTTLPPVPPLLPPLGGVGRSVTGG